MDIVKKQKIIIIVQYVIILLFLFTIGSGVVISPVYGDINVLDEGEFGGWLMHLFAGGHIFKDVYAAYGPFYIYPLYLLAKIFPPTVFLIRIVYSVLNVFFAVIIAQVILKEIKIPFWLQLFCIALLLIIPGFGMRQGIGLLAIFFVYKSVEKKKYYWSVIGGATLAVTFLTSSDMGIFSGLVSALYLTYSAIIATDMRQFLKKIFLLITSYLFIFIFFFFWAASEGWFFAYVQSLVSDLVIYSSIAIPIGENFPNAFHLMPHSFSILKWIAFILSQPMFLYWLYFFYIITFIYFFIRIILKKLKNDEYLTVMISLFGFLLATILIGRTDHLTFTLPPVFILFAFYLKNLIAGYKHLKTRQDKVVSFFFIFIIVLFSIRLISIYRPHFNDILKIPHAIATNKTSIPRLGPIAISQKQANSFITIQTFITTHTKKNDAIFIFSNDPMLYFLVDRQDATNYDLPEVANDRDKRIQILHDLQTKKSAYIIYDSTSYSVDGVSNYKRLPEVASYIKKYYSKSTVGNFIIYTYKTAK